MGTIFPLAKIKRQNRTPGHKFTSTWAESVHLLWIRWTHPLSLCLWSICMIWRTQTKKHAKGWKVSLSRKKNDNNNNISPNQITQFGILATIIGSLLCSTSYIDLSMSLLSTWAAGTRRTRSVKPSTISWLKGVRLQVTKQGKFHGFGPQIWGYIYICICMYIYIILYIYIFYIYMYDVYMFLISKTHSNVFALDISIHIQSNNNPQKSGS
jgi:hypothetical protein